MRHMIIRFVMAIIWMVATVVCLVRGQMEMAALYALMTVVFGYNVIKTVKGNKVTEGK